MVGSDGSCVSHVYREEHRCRLPFFWLMRGTERIRILVRPIRVNFAVLLRLARVAAAGICQFVIAHTS